MKFKRRWTQYMAAIASIAVASCLLFALAPHHLISTVDSHQVQAQVEDRSQIDTSQIDSSQLVETARQQYTSGQYQDALKTWQQAATAFEDKGDRLNQAMALTNLSLSAQQLGQWSQATTAIQNSIDLLGNLETSPTQQQLFASALDAQAQLHFSTGRHQAASETWIQAADIHSQLKQADRAVASQLNQARAQQELGLYSSACATLLEALGEPSDRCQVQDPQALLSADASNANLPQPLRLQALTNLGTILRVTGQLDRSYQLLTATWPATNPIATPNNPESTTLESTNLESPVMQGQLAIALGNTARALGVRQAIRLAAPSNQTEARPQPPTNCQQALELATPADYFQQAELCYDQAAQSPSQLTSIQARLNQTALAATTNPTSPSLSQLPQLQNDLERLTNSSTAINGRLNLVQTAMCLQNRHSTEADDAAIQSPLLQNCRALPAASVPNPALNPAPSSPYTWDDISGLSASALDSATELGDPTAESYALGYRAAIALQTGNIDRATELTTRALQRITSQNAPGAAYLWQWQLGRIYSEQGDREQALSAYRLAVHTLDSLRSELVAVSPEVQFNFRDSVEPVYREYVDLLLQSESPTQAELQQAREAIESLQLAELNDFFREACETQQEQAIDRIDSKAAVFYSILLPRRLAVILSVANQPLTYYTADFSNGDRGTDEVEQTFEALMAEINPAFFTPDPLHPHQQLYDWLIRPAEATLQANQIETLVFVLDGYLRGIPVAALHDGERYLVEQYAVALTPGLQLLDAQTLALDRITVLAGGIAEARQGFGELPGVKQEVSNISNLAPTDIILDGDFTRNEFQERVKTSVYPLIHIASHAQLSSRAEDTFLITWNDRINVKDLDSLLLSRRDRPIELLVLSACQTAVGDNRAALGLAGVAVRSGARSTVATLWAVQDASTADAIGEFYAALKQDNISKAKALQQAQLALLHSSQYSHPFYWAPFVLVGNWL